MLIKIKNIISDLGKQGLHYHGMIAGGKRKVIDLTMGDLRSISRFVINRKLVNIISEVARLNIPLGEQNNYLLPINKALIDITTLTSKVIRLGLNGRDQGTLFKCGLILTPSESRNYMEKVRKLTNTRHKCQILRCLHGDIYTNERLTRFGLRNDSKCNHCDEIDTLDHRLTECRRTKRLLYELENILKPLRGITFSYEHHDMITRLMAAYADSDATTVTAHAELLQALVSNTDTPERILVNIMLNKLSKLERNESIKSTLTNLLNYDQR